MSHASPAVIVFTAVGVLAAVYAFICHVRAERLGRVAVQRVRVTHPAVWQRVIADNWLLRVANPAITLKVLRARYSVLDAHFDQQLERLRAIERREYRAVAVAVACVALVLIGTRSWGWTW